MYNPDVKMIVACYLKRNGYEGLYNAGCGCELGDLFCCGEPKEDCQAGYRCRLKENNDKCGLEEMPDKCIMAEKENQKCCNDYSD